MQTAILACLTYNDNSQIASNSLQGIPQHVEVPPNIEVKRIIYCFSAVLSCQYNPLLLKDYSNILTSLRFLACHLLYSE